MAVSSAFFLSEPAGTAAEVSFFAAIFVSSSNLYCRDGIKKPVRKSGQSDLLIQVPQHHPGDARRVRENFQVAEAHAAHQPQHVVGLADAHLEA